MSWSRPSSKPSPKKAQQLDLLRAEEKKSFQHVDRIYELEKRLDKIRKTLERKQIEAAMPPNQSAEIKETTE